MLLISGGSYFPDRWDRFFFAWGWFSWELPGDAFCLATGGEGVRTSGLGRPDFGRSWAAAAIAHRRAFIRPSRIAEA